MSILFSERPYAAAVSADHFKNSDICFWCFNKVANVKRCAKCHIAAYCSKECQLKDFQTDQHRRECGVFQKLADNSVLQRDETLRLIARIVARKAKDKGIVDPNDLEGFPVGEPMRNVDDMQTNVVRVANSNPFEVGWAAFLQIYAGSSKFFASVVKDTFAEAMGLAQTNMFSIYDYHLTNGQIHLGSGLYIQSARFNHSCDPDVAKYLIGSKRVMKKLKDLDPCRSLDSLTINYNIASTVTFTETRQKALEQYYFACQCSECCNTLENDRKKFAVKTPCFSCNGVLIADPIWKVFKCYTCKTETSVAPGSPDYQAFKFIQELQRIHEGSGGTIDVSPTEYIKQAESVLHPVQNVFLLHLREEAFQQAESLFTMSKNNEFVHEMFHFGPQILASYEFYHLWASSYPVLCAKVAELAFVNGKKDLAIEYFEKAKQLWGQISYPEHHLVGELDSKIEKIKQIHK